LDQDREVIGMVELFEQDIRANDRQSSKGNQLKWKNNGIWYKADYTGYEGLAEYMISHLLLTSTLSLTEYALYDLEQIKYKSTVYNGVRSVDFVKDDWQIITLERLFQTMFHESLYRLVFRIAEPEERLRFLVNQVVRVTGLNEFGKYMNKLLTVDAFFLNEDRHTHNIAVLMNDEGKFAYCPLFDQGAGLLSDTTMDYPLGEDVVFLMGETKAKTFCDSFDEQLDVSEKLYGGNLKFSFTKREVKALLDTATIYSEKERMRVEEILFMQMEKYTYLF